MPLTKMRSLSAPLAFFREVETLEAIAQREQQPPPIQRQIRHAEQRRAQHAVGADEAAVVEQIVGIDRQNDVVEKRLRYVEIHRNLSPLAPEVAGAVQIARR